MKASTVEVMPEIPHENSPEFTQDKKKHKKYIEKAVKNQSNDKYRGTPNQNL